MRIGIFREFGPIPQIGMGHFYRSMAISKELIRRGHEILWIASQNDLPGIDILIIDHIYSKSSLILMAKSNGINVVLIDGAEEDVDIVDDSVSAFYNKKSNHRGIKYIAFQKCNSVERYNINTKNKTVFIGMGGFDANNYAKMLLNVLDRLNINAIVAKSINHENFRDSFKRVEIFEEDNYYNAFADSMIGIVNGGLTLFQAMHYGLPCIAIPQYEHQKDNITNVSNGCIMIEPNEEDIEREVLELLGNHYKRQSLSMTGQYMVDGRGVDRICSIIERLV